MNWQEAERQLEQGMLLRSGYKTRVMKSGGTNSGAGLENDEAGEQRRGMPNL